MSRWAIICLSNGGHYVEIDYWALWNMLRHINPKYRGQTNRNEIHTRCSYPNDSTIPLTFDTEQAANWFIGHRLSYHPLRKNRVILDAMNRIFELNNIDPKITKVEYLIKEIETE